MRGAEAGFVNERRKFPVAKAWLRPLTRLARKRSLGTLSRKRERVTEHVARGVASLASQASVDSSGDGAELCFENFVYCEYCV